jgi:hypothetical protein
MPVAVSRLRRKWTIRTALVSCGTIAFLLYGVLMFHGTLLGDPSSPAFDRIVTFLGIFPAVTAAPLVVLLTLWRDPSAAQRRDAWLALGFAVAFGAVCSFSKPQSDFSYYIAEGRLAAAGGNAYTDVLSAEHLVSIHPPVDLEVQRAKWPYGPGWLWIAHGLSKWTPAGTEFARFKGALLVAFLAMVGCIFGALRHESPTRQTASVVIVGWLPASVEQSVAGGTTTS